MSDRKDRKGKKKFVPYDKIAHIKALSRAHHGPVPATKFHSTERGAKDYKRRNGKEIPQD